MWQSPQVIFKIYCYKKRKLLGLCYAETSQGSKQHLWVREVSKEVSYHSVNQVGRSCNNYCKGEQHAFAGIMGDKTKSTYLVVRSTNLTDRVAYWPGYDVSADIPHWRLLTCFKTGWNLVHIRKRPSCAKLTIPCTCIYAFTLEYRILQHINILRLGIDFTSDFPNFKWAWFGKSMFFYDSVGSSPNINP